MNSETGTQTYTSGDEIQIGDNTVTLQARKGSNGIRWAWHLLDLDVSSEGYKATAEEAIANARKVLAGGECRHGQLAHQFCPRCHDSEM